MTVGFTASRRTSHPSSIALSLERGKPRPNLATFNETSSSSLRGRSIHASDHRKSTRQRISRQQKTNLVQGIQTRTNLLKESATIHSLDQEHIFEKVRWIKNRNDIHSWIEDIVQHINNPFDGWNVKSQIDFVKLLQEHHAYPSIMIFLRQLVNPNVKVCTTAMFAMVLSLEYRYLALEILDFMDEQNVQPTSLTFIALLGSVDGSKATSKTMKRIEKYKHVQLSAEVFNSAIFACKRKTVEDHTNNDSDLNDWQMPLNWLQLMRRKRIQPTVKTYDAILQVLSGTGQTHLAKSIMQQLLNTPDIKPDDRVWASAMNVCAEALDYHGTIDLINQMQASGHRPNLLHASILLKALALNGQVEMSMLVLEMMTRAEEGGNTDHQDSALPFRLPRISPDRVALNTIIAACAKAENATAALSIVQRMKDGEFQDPVNGKTIYPDLISYHNILKSCRSPEMAIQIVKEMRLSRRKRYGVVTPSSVTYAHAINACQQAETPSISLATTLISWALDDGVQPTVYMFSPAIWAAQKSGESAVALDFFLQMVDFGCTPNEVAYNGVVSALCDNGDVEHAILMYEEMKNDNLSLNSATFKRFAMAIHSKESIKESQDYLQRIVSLMSPAEKSVGIGGSILEALIRLYATQSQFDEALRTFNTIVGRVDCQCLRAILFACSTSEPPRWEDAISILHTSDIVESNSGPGRIDQVALSYAIIACAKANQVQEALTLLELYGTNTPRRSPSSIKSFNSLLSACGRIQRPDLALEVLGMMESRYGVHPDTQSYRNAVIACNKAQHDELRLHVSNLSFVSPNGKNTYKWWECALSLLRRMREDGLIPDVATFSATISACEAAGEWQRALGVLQMMMDDHSKRNDLMNIYCFNAAISACEKGQAWVEALELYERMLDIGGPIFPNVVTLNSLLVALESAGQKELARSKYYEGRKLKIVNPWRVTTTVNGERVKAMDLHKFSGAMAKAALRGFMDTLTRRSKADNKIGDLLIISGKGLHSKKDPILQTAVLSVLANEYRVDAKVDDSNQGRIIVTSRELRKFLSRNAW